jgi:lipoprotein-anchoring transpeptidase ErfK/SrfK
MWSRLIACTILIGALGVATTAQAQILDERFNGGAPKRDAQRVTLRTAAVPPANAPGPSLASSVLSRLLGGFSAISRTTVSFPGNHDPGTIVINTTERRLYYVLGGGQAIRYGIGVGRVGFTWAGETAVSEKREWPDWTPPPQMLARKPGLPHFMKGGIDNPLGARAMYLGSSLYRIHGSNEPETIGTATSSGCFRLTNDDVIDLYARVKVGTKVIVLR